MTVFLAKVEVVIYTVQDRPLRQIVFEGKGEKGDVIGLSDEDKNQENGRRKVLLLYFRGIS